MFHFTLSVIVIKYLVTSYVLSDLKVRTQLVILSLSIVWLFFSMGNPLRASTAWFYKIAIFDRDIKVLAESTLKIYLKVREKINCWAGSFFYVKVTIFDLR
ncbi:hypothetical protein PHYBLDRAFT_73443 [Phycomyces blakesleeanus NRRL 1555(-)]|uniref:Uncharacterized protein n=1 Tax=Phycomyces blakesleeanus (strain ATCC 8743b / DSM 1359 / FGSC 10004 / NBRC 33097 / NRRL 1555) TaxID=763407 RepID=A0A162VBT7_PHYB8|nr:hypothetical protein PHYBLDRAFT_73443 [Phycomyces blakesleeanus NRRL 1555(-)]OAD81553.1 hypothetical protein PHYBLDRAFT_73443 [Phycomyces blakesleeanus NRRL 1555(-)]|eukprot:XP_018299593.1 hypothetical protein PHYBLDRAFT_73443 [Phycomyces blakesleeanus NRRL 1555(-)]